MGLKFVGGPYDGMEIDQALINKYAHVSPVTGELGTRLFVLMPDSREVWERLVRGEDVKPDKRLSYERVFSPGGAYFVATPPGSVDRALSEARLKIHPRARTALAALSAEDSRRVIEAAAALRRQPPHEWPKEEVLRLSADKDIYLLGVTPELRAFIRVVEGGQVELLDIVREDTLRLFLERYRDAGVAQ